MQFLDGGNNPEFISPMPVTRSKRKLSPPTTPPRKKPVSTHSTTKNAFKHSNRTSSSSTALGNNDRYIPNKSPESIANSQFLVRSAMTRTPTRIRNRNSNQSFLQSNEEPIKTEADSNYSQHLARACGLQTDSNVLHFQNSPHTPVHTPSSGSSLLNSPSKIYSSSIRDNSAEDLRLLYARPADTNSPTSPNYILHHPLQNSTPRPKHPIPVSASRVLDAPAIRDDFYTDLLDWSSASNFLGVGLASVAYLWEESTGNVTNLHEVDENSWITAVSFSMDGKKVAIGSSDGQIVIFDVVTTNRLFGWSMSSAVGTLSWSINNTLSCGTKDGNLTDYQYIDQADDIILKRRVLNAHEDSICCVRWSVEGKLLASGGNDNAVHIWETEKSVPKLSIRQHRAAVKAIAFSPWKRELLATGIDVIQLTISFYLLFFLLK